MDDELEKSESTAAIIGWMATIVGVLMWSSLADQVRLNLMGQKGSIIFAIAVVLNCTLWTIYGLKKTPRLWPVVVSNVPGIVLGLLAALTSI